METKDEERKAHKGIKKTIVNYYPVETTRRDNAIQEINATENTASDLMTDLDKEKLSVSTVTAIIDFYFFEETIH